MSSSVARSRATPRSARSAPRARCPASQRQSEAAPAAAGFPARRPLEKTAPAAELAELSASARKRLRSRGRPERPAPATAVRSTAARSLPGSRSHQARSPPGFRSCPVMSPASGEARSAPPSDRECPWPAKPIPTPAKPPKTSRISGSRFGCRCHRGLGRDWCAAPAPAPPPAATAAAGCSTEPAAKIGKQRRLAALLGGRGLRRDRDRGPLKRGQRMTAVGGSAGEVTGAASGASGVSATVSTVAPGGACEPGARSRA